MSATGKAYRHLECQPALADEGTLSVPPLPLEEPASFNGKKSDPDAASWGSEMGGHQDQVEFERETVGRS